ncbi:hypothetical protein EVAR_70016_1 [Eumeta japonica]|uniref:Uncharacterized protein n=1 Tax=Eumeta variegata TaxID=151549 RepID=A0A4C2AHX7_EUMVA|nr:hypothetical protein EVAR_70016_1 [Eumeta japonica]
MNRYLSRVQSSISRTDVVIGPGTTPKTTVSRALGISAQHEAAAPASRPQPARSPQPRRLDANAFRAQLQWAPVTIRRPRNMDGPRERYTRERCEDRANRDITVSSGEVACAGARPTRPVGAPSRAPRPVLRPSLGRSLENSGLGYYETERIE